MQFSNIYGVGNKTGNLVSYTLGELMSGKEATFGPALQPYDFIYVEDLIEAVYRLGAKETNKSFYYIGSGTPHLLKEYLLRIGELAGRGDMVHIGVRPDDGVKYKKDMFDNSDLIDAIGNYNKTNFDKGIMSTIAWLSDIKRGGIIFNYILKVKCYPNNRYRRYCKHLNSQHYE
jgi:nucleoside-diphosphate-sugar epimerase